MQWTLRVSPFWRLRTRLPCHLLVRALDPLAHPDGERVRVAVRGAERGARGLQVEYDAARREVAVLSDDIDPRALVEVDAPLRFGKCSENCSYPEFGLTLPCDRLSYEINPFLPQWLWSVFDHSNNLSIESSGSGSVTVQNIECDCCRIDTAQGTSILQSVKSQKLHVQTKGGNVNCLGTIYGNIDIHASRQSTVTVDKLQGSCVNISTEDGMLKVKYLYTESSFLTSAAGDIALGNVHGNITLQSKMGNITVDSSSGCLKASSHQGAIDVYVSQLGEVALTSQEGAITIKAPPSLQAYLRLSGIEVVVDPEAHVQEMAKEHEGGSVTVTGLMNQASRSERWINAVAPKGTVSFKHQSWFQSLKLQD
ncbi:protein of unknown function (DUF4098) [Cricetulus griseus]|uniref:DUF4097 domain-containing protein n=1 Tax=Cricetulus griseus TaxID=10029 RepID=A0A061IL48_CRIGR|nr:protein of unknown function (DUF4098) [Cricetulus griseus]